MIWIRADANSEIGTGHVMRCLSIAAELKKLGVRVCFLAADENPVPLFQARGQEYRILHTDYRKMEQESDILENMFREQGGGFFLADSYFVTAEYFRRIKACLPAASADRKAHRESLTGTVAGHKDDRKLAGTAASHKDDRNLSGTAAGHKDDGNLAGTAASHKGDRNLTGVSVGYMDDKGLTGLPVDVLINYNIFGSAELYGELPDGVRLLLGPRYAPLREEFRNREYQVRDRASRVLLTTGGADKYNLAGRFLRKVLAGRTTATGLEYYVVSGAYNVHLEDLRELEKNCPNVHILCGVTNMAELMLKCDIAVTAGGSTMYEFSAIGVPMLCFSFVDNQEGIVEGFRKRDLVYFGGNYLLQGEGMLAEAAEKLGELAADKELRKSCSERQRRVTDGLGAVRLARELAGMEIVKRKG